MNNPESLRFTRHSALYQRVLAMKVCECFLWPSERGRSLVVSLSRFARKHGKVLRVHNYREKYYIVRIG